MLKKAILPIFILLTGYTLSIAQKSITVDKIIAVIGDKVILQSDLNIRMIQLNQTGATVPTDDSSICSNLRDMVGEKILAVEAQRDSTINAKITNEMVDNQVQQKIDEYARRQFGGDIQKMEQFMGKTVYQLKEESRDPTRDNMLAMEMRSKILTDVKVTPKEVKAFYDSLSDNDKPLIPATVEVGQIIIKPDVSPEIDKYTHDKLGEIRTEIVDSGKDFALMAGIYSQDPGSKDNGGEYTIDRNNFDPAFVAAAFKLQPGEVSPVIKSSFGYHIIKMEKRMGDKAVVRHILLIPDITSADIQKTMDSMQKIYTELKDKKTTFQKAVDKYSNDKDSKMMGGMVTDRFTNSTSLELSNLDPDMTVGISGLQPGQFSEPQTFTNPQTGQKSCRILYLISRTDPHKLNMDDDYSKIQQAALKKKQSEYLLVWMRKNIHTQYIKIDPEYQKCDVLKEWVKLSDE